ncbi:MAG: response regulator [FCB group bacterium]|nr:response regulator [FCB group bacterium]
MKQVPISICIVDDEQPIVELLNTYFIGKGYTVHGFTVSIEAREFLKKNPVDIVFTDLKMPEITGLDIVDTVKEYQKDTMVIIFTGYASIDSAIHALQQGVYDYLRKPFKLTEIQAVLNRAVEKQLLRRDNIRLQKQIEKMLADLTMLYDISSIMYQVPDLNLVGDMIMDTLSEGMGVHHGGIFIETKSAGSYELLKSRGLPVFFKDNPLNLSTKINDDYLIPDKTSVFSVEASQINIDGTMIPVNRKAQSLVMIPIQFMNRPLGYLCVLDPRTGLHAESEDLKLYKIIATQISPLLFSRSGLDVGSDSHVDTTVWRDVDLIQSNLISHPESSKISFILLQLFQIDGLKAIPDKDMDYCQELLHNEFASLTPRVSRILNNLICVLPSANPIETELKLMEIKSKFDQKYNGTALQLRCGLANYPTDGQHPKELLNHLVFSTYNEFPEQPEKDE